MEVDGSIYNPNGIDPKELENYKIVSSSHAGDVKFHDVFICPITWSV